MPQLQRRFLMLYTEWLARERIGAYDHLACPAGQRVVLKGEVDWRSR